MLAESDGTTEENLRRSPDLNKSRFKSVFWLAMKKAREPHLFLRTRRLERARVRSPPDAPTGTMTEPMESEMFGKKFMLACPVAALSLTFSAVQAEEVVGKAAGLDVQVVDARAAVLARLHQRVIRFCDLNQVSAGLAGSNFAREADACRADLINELTVKPGDIQLIGVAPRSIRVAPPMVVASIKPAS